MTGFDCSAIAATLSERYHDELRGDALVAMAPLHNKRLCLRLVIEDREQRHRWILEAGVTRPPKTRDEPAAYQLVIAFLDAYLSDWFNEDRDTRLSLNYRAHTFGDKDVFLRGRRRDLRAERLAAELLDEPLEPDLDEVD